MTKSQLQPQLSIQVMCGNRASQHSMTSPWAEDTVSGSKKLRSFAEIVADQEKNSMEPPQ